MSESRKAFEKAHLRVYGHKPPTRRMQLYGDLYIYDLWKAAWRAARRSKK